MSLPLIGIIHHVVEHLHALGMLQFPVLLVAHRFRDILVDQLPHLLPRRRVVHPQEMVALSDELLADHVDRPIAADRASLVEDLLDELPIRQNDRGCWSYLQAEDASVLL